MERWLLVTRIALRNLLRQLRRSSLTASAMILGIGLLMFIRALEGGAHLMYVETVNLIGGLTDPTRGQVLVDGRNVSAMSERQRAQLRLNRIGFVFQAYNLLPVLTAMENAEFPLMLRGVDRDERRGEVVKLFDHIGLGGLENRRPGTLSGGQQQRVAVARAVLGAPALVLADEPTANLDTQASDAVHHGPRRAARVGRPGTKLRAGGPHGRDAGHQAGPHEHALRGARPPE